jgi:GT2 family glycosyltransferase
MKVSIVIPAYKPASLLAGCLERIIKNTILSDIEIIVVCNGSDRESAEIVMNLGEPFKLVWCADALGFTKATNIGIKLATGEYVVIMNTDAYLLDYYDKNVWLNRLIDPFKDTKVGITGVGVMWSDFGKFLPFFCTAIRRTLFDELGLLDERFSPGYNEDADFCYRAVRARYDLLQVDNPHVDENNPTRTITDFPIHHLGEQSFTDKDERKKHIDRNFSLLKQIWEQK